MPGSSPWDRSRRRQTRELRRLLDTLDGDPGPSTKDALRGLIAAGLSRYAGIVDKLPDEAAPRDVMLDLAGAALWPVVVAPSLPKDWVASLQEMSSPPLARAVSHARSYRSDGHHLPIAGFMRSLAVASVAAGLYQLFDDMSDPRRGGCALTAVALAGRQPPPTLRDSRRTMLWVLGAAAAGIVGNESDRLLETLWNDIASGHSSYDGSGAHDPMGSTAHGGHHSGDHRDHGQGLLSVVENLFH